MKKGLISVLLIMALFIGALPTTTVSAAASGRINISLPSFKVTMNGELVKNDYSKYPLIVYNGITYFPMTYHDCRFLGIESTWTGNTTGLFIDSTGVTVAYNPYLSKEKNGKSYTATVPAFPISVNGKAIDNSKEEYPIILFRDITYFPMTWKYCVEQFAWDYSFDSNNGLVIKSANVKLDRIRIPADRLTEAFGDYAGKKSTAVMAKNGFCYYVDNKGAIMQAPLSDLSRGKMIFQLEILSSGDRKQFDDHSFYEENGKAMLFFRVGGGVMGSDYRYVLKEDGTTLKIQNSYHETTLIGDKLYMCWVGPTPGPGNLRIKNSSDVDIYDDDKFFRGAADYWYYHLCDIKGLPKLELAGNELYLRASKVLKGYDEDGRLVLAEPAVYKANTSTGAMTKVSQSEDKVVNAQMVGEHIYYLCVKGEGDQRTYDVYRHSLKDASETVVGSFGNKSWRADFAVVGDHVYYAGSESLYCLGKNESLNPKAEVLSISITGDDREFLACTFMETPDSRYRVMVFDKSGNVVFKTSDSGSNIVVEGDTLFFYNITTETLCKAALK